MPLPDPASRARLAEMGIEVWAARTRTTPRAPTGDDGSRSEPRVRLSSGDGDWLLVQRRPWDGRHAPLLADIQALLGPERCRFGQWADSPESGQALSELNARGIRHLVSFGPPPHAGGAELIEAAVLDELAVSAEARRRLWRALLPRLSD